MSAKYKRTKSLLIEVISDIMFRIIAFIPNIFRLISHFFKNIF
ncbi:hypothetical protein DOD22_2513 [Staphylococcus arlettae]|nr:hypothetical protein DOD22_2513 [Staphylococcus arlettae]